MTRQRGQTLVLFALTLLLVTLMVLVTLEIASRAHDRVEAQIAADTSAYSAAVSTARAFNEVAVLNRLSIAYMVSMASTQSYISYAGAVRGAYNDATLSGCAFTPPPMLTNANWITADVAAGQQVMSEQSLATVALEQTAILDSLEYMVLQNQRQAQRIASNISPTLVAPLVADPANVNMTQIDRIFPYGKPGTAGPQRTSGTEDAVYATMGSRGDPWVSGRNGGSGFGDPPAAEGGGVPSIAGIAGAVAAERYGGTEPNGVASWAEDQSGQVTVVCAKTGPQTFVSAGGYVVSSALQYHDDEHFYDGTNEGPEGGQQQWQIHTLGTCAVCPGIWPFFTDMSVSPFNSVGSRIPPLFGQPSLVSVVQRDYTDARTHRPWTLSFSFKALGSTEKFDNGSDVGPGMANGALRFQVAAATAAAYYHRMNPQNHKEFANVFNPFWRATLVSGYQIDKNTGPTAVQEANQITAAGQASHAQVLKDLRLRGYRGY